MGENRPSLIHFFGIVLVLLLLYTRFAGGSWGFPYPMHPDERNMANAVQNLNCNVKCQMSNVQCLSQCFNPHFFAYGQFSLYLGYLLIKIFHLFLRDAAGSINFSEAVMALRTISAVSSVLNAFFLMLIIRLFLEKKYLKSYEIIMIVFLVLIFSPYFIQLSHFGTTESLLMFFYTAIIFISLKIMYAKNIKRLISFAPLMAGLAIATKLSSLIFVLIPLVVFLYRDLTARKGKFFNKIQKSIGHIIFFAALSFFFFFLFSPHNLISLNDFLSTFHYESDVATGMAKVFYTRQFVLSTPVLFQVTKIFPYVLGWPQFILFFFGFLFLSWRNAKLNLLRFSFTLYFLPTAFLFAKWTRFVSPVFPIMSIFALLFLIEVYKKLIANQRLNTKSLGLFLKSELRLADIFFALLLFLTLIPGIAFMRIYLSPDVRFTSSKWVYENMPAKSYILSETANVVDIPVSSQLTKTLRDFPAYTYISFNFYDLDENPRLEMDMQNHLAKADYIFVPSRRVFYNHTCYRQMTNEKLEIKNFYKIEESACQKIEKKYPKLNKYYNDLFRGRLGFRQVAKFTSFPRIEFFGKKIIEFPDEDAEETWTVFDHPVIRIYKRIKNYE